MCSSWPRRSPSPTMMREPRQGRLPAVLHLLHLAQREVGDRGVHEGADSTSLTSFFRPNFWRQHTRHPARTSCSGAASSAFTIRAVLASTLSPLVGRLLRLRAIRERCAPVRVGGVPGLGEVPISAAELEGALKESGENLNMLLGRLRSDSPGASRIAAAARPAFPPCPAFQRDGLIPNELAMTW